MVISYFHIIVTDRIAALKINVSQLTSDSVDRNNNSHCWNDKPTGIKSTTSSNAAQLRTVAAMYVLMLMHVCE